MSITTSVSLLVYEFDVRSILRGQVSLAAVNQICVIHEAMNSSKNLKIHNKFYDRAHRLYDAALLTRCYTQHNLALKM